MAIAAEQLVEQLLPTPEIPLSNPIWTCYVNLEYWKEAGDGLLKNFRPEQE